MKNHYYTHYVGNKRKEIKDILPLINLDNITTIIEPFAGSSAMSYYISTQYPNRFKYILNDNDKINYEMFNISKDLERTQEFNDNINIIINEFNTYTDDENRKIFYVGIDVNTLQGYIFKAKYCCMRTGLYPLISRIKQIKPFKLQDYPIYDFFNNEDITYENTDGIDIINKHNKNKDKLFLLDPPYLKSYNKFYNNFNMDIYKWIFDNESLLLHNKNKIVFILENIKEVQQLLKKFNILLEYDKQYEIGKRRRTTHIVYEN